MSNVIPFRATEFVNIHGKPVGVSMKQLVLVDIPNAWCHHRVWTPPDREPTQVYTIRVPEFNGEPPEMQGFIGSGGTEESAWRAAYFTITDGRKA